MGKGSGNCLGGNANNNDIDAKLKKDSERNKKEVKLLLLGAGESGKSTLFKQMKIIHHNGYTKEECLVYKDIIRGNVLHSMKSLVAATHKLSITLESKENRSIAAKINQFDQEALLNIQKIYTEDLGDDLAKLWQDKGIQEAYGQRSNFQLLDSTEYFFKKINEISAKDFVPNEQDVLRCRVKTTGIVETEFEFNGFKFKLYDVGGQRNERKKWIHCFDNVTAVIFVTSLSEYDLKCYEDDSTLRMKESLVLFDEICNSRYFQETCIMLFFNKTDLFRDKIKKVDLNVCFPEYRGGKDYDKATNFIDKEFKLKNQDADGKQIYTHFTCATDTENITSVFAKVKNAILEQNNKSSSV